MYAKMFGWLYLNINGDEKNNIMQVLTDNILLARYPTNKLRNKEFVTTPN